MENDPSMWINDYADSTEEPLLVADGFEEAILGVGHQFNTAMVVYDRDRVISVLEGWGMTNEEAWEYFFFNVQGAWVGPNTPLFLTRVVADD